jgi:hypothetical protein
MRPCGYVWSYKTFSINLAQNAGTYDLITSVNDVVIDPNMTCWYVNAAGGAFTSCSVQTNHTTPYVWLSAIEGALATFSAQATIAPVANVPFMLRNGQKVQYTIVGNGNAGLVLVEVAWRSGLTTGGSI